MDSDSRNAKKCNFRRSMTVGNYFFPFLKLSDSHDGLNVGKKWKQTSFLKGYFCFGVEKIDFSDKCLKSIPTCDDLLLKSQIYLLIPLI